MQFRFQIRYLESLAALTLFAASLTVPNNDITFDRSFFGFCIRFVALQSSVT